MTMSFSEAAARRRRYRRLALYGFFVFLAISTVIHFTVGSLVTMLLPKHQAPLDEAIAIITIDRSIPDQVLTIEHLQRDPQEQPKQPKPVTVTQKVTVQPQQQRQPQPQQMLQQLARSASSALASIVAPSRKASLSKSSDPRQQESERGSVSAVRSPMGSAAASAQAGSAGTGDMSGEGANLPGRQIPTGPVWTDQGPPGQNSGVGGGILLGGGEGGSGNGHDSCAPSRGNFF
jgi:hypothetical protein